MTVKNVAQFHSYTSEKLNGLTTRHLKDILDSSRGKIICSCGKGHHCGDEVLSIEEKLFNEKQEILFKRVKEILATRPNLTSTKQRKKKEKKVLAY